MSQYEQENDLGGGGGEVDEDTMERAWRTADGPRTTADDAEREPPTHDDAPDPARDLE